MRRVGGSCFGASVLIGSDDVGAVCLNSNGLPSVSSSVKMIGKFQRLLLLRHRNICAYIDLLRCTSVANSVILIAEHFETSLADALHQEKNLDVQSIASQIVCAVSYLHSELICIGFLKSSSIRMCVEGDLLIPRLSQYGLRHVTNDSRWLLESLRHDFYIAPELLLDCEWRTTFSSDIWAVGIILFELAVGTTLDKVWSLGQYQAVLEEILLAGSESVYDGLLESVKNSSPGLMEIPNELETVVRMCLSTVPSKRPAAGELIRMLGIPEKCETKKRVRTLEEIRTKVMHRGPNWKFETLPIDIAFFLWKLCGSSAEAILVKNGHIRVHFPIMTLPIVVIEDLRLFGNDESRRCCSPLEIFSLPSSNLLEKVNTVDGSLLCWSVYLNGVDLPLNYDLGLLVKEKDIVYQMTRSCLIRHLLLSRDDLLLRRAVSYDIPPMVRGNVWSRLLNVREGDIVAFFELDTLAPHSSDRQLDVDIPRCHQYDELMTSPTAHWKLRRLLKAWLLKHPNYVYWQGCDSLSTPFLLLHFNNLPVALSCLSEFVNRYLCNFFLKDNSAVIQEHLAVFFHLLAYIDSKFYSALVAMDFYPELFAIPWFLTCFAHVLPIHKLLHVWDVLLLHDSSYPLFLGLALLRQLRPQIIDTTFNDVILLFSDLPDMSMDRVIEDSTTFYKRVPPSCSRRCFASEVTADSDALRNLPCTLRPLPHTELRQWHCPRMSPEEFEYRVIGEHVAVLDIRSNSEFLRGHVVRSFNCPPNASALLTVGEVLKAAQRNQHPICVVGGKYAEALKEFVRLLVLEQYINGVCVLDGGYASIRDMTQIIDISH